MSWTQWPGGQPPPAVAAAPPPLINPAPAVVPPGLPYSTTDQWSQMQQQNWQQWAQWQQQYQQWHQQYGAEYQKSMNALAAQQPVVHNLAVPPPLPIEPQPPLPLDEVPKPAPPLPLPAAVAAPPQPPVSQYSTQPPPSNNFSAPPPNFNANPLQDWRSVDNSNLDQKRSLSNAEESPAKRQMMNRQGFRPQVNTSGQTTQQWPGQNHSNLEELSEAEKKFDKQFAEWEAQFNKWKEQNSGHPDKQQYKEYEKKWEQWRQQLLERREAMRKKRLGLTGANKAPSNQNFNVPPPLQGQAPGNIQATPPMIPQSIPHQKAPSSAAPSGPPKEPLLPTPDIFSKPPPNMNDEPLQFKKSEGEEEEHQEEAIGFLNTSKSDGIPGLDLVKDGEFEPEEEENSEQVPQKGPDLEAISKGINNILGDQKLMSMLSMVSQTQNSNHNSNINTMSKINEQLPPADQSNLSMGESPNERFAQSETVQNFDDQTRSSFTMQPNDQEFYRGPPPGNQFNRGGFQGNFDGEPPFNRGPMPNDRFDNRQFSGPGDNDFRRPPPNRFGRGVDNAVDSDPSRGSMMNRNSGNFDRAPLGPMGRDDFNSKGPSLLGPGRSNSFGSSGPGALNRDSFVTGGMDRDISGPRNINRDQLGPDGLNRDPSFPGSMNRDPLGPGNLNRDSYGPGGITRDTSGSMYRNRTLLGTGGMNRDILGPEGKNRGTFGQGGINRDSFGQRSFSKDSLGPGGMTRDSFESAGMNRDSLGVSGMNRGILGQGGKSSVLGGMNRNSFGPGDANRDLRGSGDINRDTGIPGGMIRDAYAPGSMNKGPTVQQGNINRDKFGPGINRDDFGPPGPGNLVPGNRDEFGLSSRQFSGPGLGGAGKERFEPVGGENMDRGKFESNLSNLEGRSQFGRHNMEIDRDDFGSRPSDAKFGRRGGPNLGDRRNSRGDDIDYGDNARRDGIGFDEDTFPPNRRLSDGPSGRRGDFGGPLGNFNQRRNDFEQMSMGMRPSEGLGFRNDRTTQERENFGHRDGLDDDFEPRGFGIPFNKDESGNFEGRDKLHPNKMGHRFAPRNFGNDRGQHFRDGFHENFREEEDDYPPPPPLFDQLGQNDNGSLHNRGNPLLDPPEPPHLNRGAFDNERFVEEQYSKDGHGNDFPVDIAPLEQALEDLWKPVKVIDYDHRSLKEPEMDILLEPFRMFDYRHKPLDRIPFPERPNWLSDAVRMIPEFDPPMIRAPLIERRVYEDRFEPSPFRRDDRYDSSRMDDRYRHERRGFDRFSPPPSRGRDYEDANWSSSRGNRSRSPLRYEKPLHGGDKMDRGSRNKSRERVRDWEQKGRNREGGSRDWEIEKKDWKVNSKDWNSKDERRDRGDRDDYRDRGNRDDIKDRADRGDLRDRGDRQDHRDRGERDDHRDRGDIDDHRDRGDRDRGDRDRGDRDDNRDRGERDDYRDRGDRDDHRDRGRDKEDNWKNKNKEWEERGRQWEEESVEMGDKARSRERELRFRNDRNVDGDFGRNDYNRRTGGEIFPLIKPIEEKKPSNVTMIEELINPPGRSNRPPRIVIILRGPPGSGKTYLAKLIKDKEVENGGSAPRILSLDDYFMVEQEKEIMEEGKRIKTKDMVYEFEAEMEESYRVSLMRSFKKTITDGYFSFIIVDNVNDKVKHFGEMWSFAKQNGFQVYVCQLDLDVQNCTKRNVHNRTEVDIRKCVDGWEDTPAHHPVLDVSFLTQEEPISEVEMEEIDSPGSDANDDGSEDHLDRSKWDNFDCSINNLARLDGVNKPLRTSRTMEEYLQLDDDWQPTKPSKPGQKRVRWADLEERKQQEKMRAIGFVVGQTDWERMMDPTLGESALTQTKYIEKTQRRRF